MDLAQVLRQLPAYQDPNLLVGTATGDDAAVYRLTDEIALVQTVDFFPPIVDDPYDFGAIAVANALSDIYAMGGRPLMGLNIVGFPVDLGIEILGQVLRGGADKAREAGITIVGGHTIDDQEPKYGLAVTGMVKPGEQVTNVGAQPGDRLVLTKPLGTGVITTAAKRRGVDPALLAHAVKVMSTLNKTAAHVMLEVGVHACTDVTGFGLLGHLRGMLVDSQVDARVWLSQVPVFDGVRDLVTQGFVPGGTTRNVEALSSAVHWEDDVSEEAQILLCDAQTSGGLLMAIPPTEVDRLVGGLRSEGTPAASVIGEIVADGEGRVTVGG